MAHLRRLLMAGAVAACVTAFSAGAAPTLVAPASGASMTTSRPEFSWRFAPGELGESISIGKKPTLDPNTGEFATADIAGAAILDPDQTKWRAEQPLAAGRYWWHVASHTDGEMHIFSPLRSFTIRPSVRIEKVAVKTYKLQRTFLITVGWRANVHKVAYAAELRQGSKRIAVRKLQTDNFLIDSRKQDLSTWIVPPTVKKGARLRFVVSLKPEGGRKVTSSKTLRAP